MLRFHSRKLPFFFVLAVATLVFPARATDSLRTTVAEVACSLQEITNAETPFEFTARLTYVRTRHAFVIAVEDGSGAVVLSCGDKTPQCLRPGDLVYVKGAVRQIDTRKCRAEADEVQVLSHGPLPTPRPVTLAEILQGKLDYRLVRTTGVLRDCCRSETNAKWIILVINDGNALLYVSVPVEDETDTPLKDKIGAIVALTGVVLPGDFTARQRIGRTLKLANEAAVTILNQSESRQLPSLEVIGPLSPSEISVLGRHSISGRVLAAWAGNNVLLRTPRGDLHGLTVSSGPVPACGQAIEAVGFPESDLFRLNLTHATWNPLDAATDSGLPSGQSIRVRDLIMDERGTPLFSSRHHGAVLSVVGEVISHANDANGFGRLFIRSDGIVFPVELTKRALDVAMTIPPSSQVKVTGVCILDTDSWRPNSAFPQIRGFRLVARAPEDIHLLVPPPFWTPTRLLAVIGVLLGTLAAIFVWNLALRRKAESRGRELAQESIARLASDLKVGERTHLAVELHDTLSQAITGACLEVNAAQEFIKSDIPSATRYLSLAAKTLASCRNELRNCLWDLRSRALEEPDLNVAIRRTLEPYVGEDVALSIRFNVARKSLPDNTVHALMRIVRELVLNAIRHGEAHTVAVAGCIEDNRLLFSVKDDGCGFDTANVPGSATGHFGLQGIRERIQDFDGSMSIESATGRCTKVVVSISLSETKNPA